MSEQQGVPEARGAVKPGPEIRCGNPEAEEPRWCEKGVRPVSISAVMSFLERERSHGATNGAKEPFAYKRREESQGDSNAPKKRATKLSGANRRAPKPPRGPERTRHLLRSAGEREAS